jgi:hypothetical protein
MHPSASLLISTARVEVIQILTNDHTDRKWVPSKAIDGWRLGAAIPEGCGDTFELANRMRASAKLPLTLPVHSSTEILCCGFAVFSRDSANHGAAFRKCAGGADRDNCA